MLVEAARVDAQAVAQAEIDTILDHFGGSRAAYLAALGGRRRHRRSRA